MRDPVQAREWVGTTETMLGSSLASLFSVCANLAASEVKIHTRAIKPC